MKPIDLLIVGIIAMILGAAALYIYKAKKKGVKCIGCPDGSKCSGACSGCCGCSQEV